MLARTMKSANELGIREDTRQALILFLGMAERGELVHTPVDHHQMQAKGVQAWLLGNHVGRVNMAEWAAGDGCNTVMCIGGATEALMGCPLNTDEHRIMYGLFYPAQTELWSCITVPEMAAAVAQFLAHGNAVNPWDK